MIDLFSAGWLATPQEIVHSAQIFTWIHALPLAIWLQKHWLVSERHQKIRAHRMSGHKGSPFRCEIDACATL